MKNKSLISINDYSKEQIIKILDLAEDFEKNPNQKLLEGKVVASLFLSPLPAPASVSRAPSAGWEAR